MVKNILTKAFLLFSLCSVAQAYDPIVMKIAGEEVKMSELEYSYNKNNTQNTIDKKALREYIPLFVAYKLKVRAAKDAKLDTLSSFIKEFRTYRNETIRPSFITDEDVEKEAKKIYLDTQHQVDSMGGLIKPAHILLALQQKASKVEQDKAKGRIDSIYNALQKGADFATLAKKLSDDKNSSKQGGSLPWIQKGQTIKEFEDVAYSLRKGEISRPILTPIGYHIIRLEDRRNFFPYDSVRADIVRFIEQRGIRNAIIDKNIDSLALAQGEKISKEDILDQRSLELSAQDKATEYLIKEYHDGLLLYEISNRYVWEPAIRDEQGLKNYFKKHKKQYNWDLPRFKGIAYHTKDITDVKRVKETLKGIPFNKWNEKLQKTFNNDSTIRIKVEKGIFKVGDNPLIDKDIFHIKEAKQLPMGEYIHAATYGKILKQPKELDDVRALVLSDYQAQKEREWVENLKKKYPVKVYWDKIEQ